MLRDYRMNKKAADIWKYIVSIVVLIALAIVIMMIISKSGSYQVDLLKKVFG